VNYQVLLVCKMLRGRVSIGSLEEDNYKEIALILEEHVKVIETLSKDIKQDMELLQAMQEKYKEPLPGAKQQQIPGRRPELNPNFYSDADYFPSNK